MSPIMPDHPYSNESLRILITQLREENARIKIINTALKTVNSDLVESFNFRSEAAREAEETFVRIHNEQQEKITHLNEINSTIRTHINELTRRLNNYAQTNRETQTFYQRMNAEHQAIIRSLKKEITDYQAEKLASDKTLVSLRQEIKNLNAMIERLCLKELEEAIKKDLVVTEGPKPEAL